MPTNTSINTPNQAKTYLEPGQAITAKCAANITGKRFVKIAPGGVGNHPNVIHATAGGAAYGTSHFDQVNGGHVSVLRGGTFEVTAGENLAAGDEVSVGANGVAVKATPGSQLTTGTYAYTPPSRVVGVVLADTASGAGAPITPYI